jgi:3-oxo-5-alpha-steroid 4-dehydrogenase 1
MSEYPIYRILLFVFLGLAAAACAAIFFVTVPYGRHRRPGWGHLVRGRWGWFLMESPSFFVFLFVFLLGPNSSGLLAFIFFLLWEGHYVQRSLVYPFLIRSREKSVPLSVIVMAMAFTSLNGYLNGRWLYKFSGGYSASWLTGLRFIFGASLFVAGLIINLHSDSLLRSLRAPGESGYKVPRGGLFRYVSCANYFGEIVEWFGWALATWSLAGLGFAVWTVANLAPRARSHHLWYRRTFPDYPPERKALVPFLI